MTLVKIHLEQTVDLSEEELTDLLDNVETEDNADWIDMHFIDVELDRIQIQKRQGAGFTTVFDSEDE